MSSIDNRIVNMQFNNKEFEKHAKQTMSTLDKLKMALKFDGVAKGFDAITNASKNVTFSALTTSVGAVTNNFSALEQMAVGALRRIGEQAVTAGESLIKSLSVDQITTGFAKYEEKTRAVQTIINATGKSIDDVEYALGKLNWFTDETSYSFSDMVNNIGKFTAAGVDLDDAVMAMEGISNWAAVSGQGIGEASRAMYNLSQALSVGSVKLMDWRSIQLANMGTVEFKQTAIDTAVAMGTLRKVGKDLYETIDGNEVSVTNFENSLKDAWFSSEVLIKVLGKYGEYADEVYKMVQERGITAAQAMDILTASNMELGKKSFKAAQEAKTFAEAIEATKDAVSTGFMVTFDTIFGNYEQAKVLWTDLANALYDVFAEPGNYRNEQFKIWAQDMRGRERLLRGLYSIAGSLMTYLEKLSDAFHDIFGQWDAKTVSSITTEVNKIANAFEATGQRATMFYIVIKQVLNAIKLSAQAIGDVFTEVGASVKKGFFNVFGKEYEKIKQLNFQKTLTSVAQSVVKFARHLRSVYTENDRIYRIIRGVFSVVHIIKTAVGSLFKMLFPSLKNASEEGLPLILELIAKLSDKITLFDKKHRVEQFMAHLKSLPKHLTPIKEAFLNLTAPIRNYLANIKNVANFNIFDFALKIKERLLGIGVAIQEAGLKIQTLTQEAKESPIAKMFDSVVETIKRIKEKAKELLPSISELGTSLGNLWGAFKEVLADDPDFLIRLLVGGQAIGLIGSMKAFINSLTGVVEDKGGLEDVKKTFEGPFISLKKGIDKVSKGIDKVLTSASKSLNAFTSSIKADNLKKIAISIAILAGSLLVLSVINPEALSWALGTITGLFIDLVASMSVISKAAAKGMSFKGMGVLSQMFLEVAGAILVLSIAVRVLSSIEPKSLIAGLLALQVMIFDIVILSKTLVTMNNGAGLSKAGAGLIAVAIAIRILAGAVASLGELNIGVLVRGLLAVISLTSMLAIFLQVTDETTMGVGTGLGLVLLSAALKILADVVSELGAMSLKNLGMGLGSIAVSLTILITALSLMPKDILAKSVSLLVMSVALNAVASAITALSKIGIEQLGLSVLALTVVIMGMAIALKFMETAMPGANALLVASAALTTFVVAIKLLSAIPAEGILIAMSALAIAMGLLAVAAIYLTPLAPSMILLAGALALLGLGLSLIAGAVFLFSIAMLTFSTALAGGASALLFFLTTMLKAVPILHELIVVTLTNLVAVALDIVGELLARIIDLFLTTATELLTVLNEKWPGFLDQLLALIVSAINVLTNRVPELMDALVGFVIALVNGLCDAIENHSDQIKEALKRVLIGALGALGSLGIFIGSAALKIMQEFGNAIKEKKDQVWDKLSKAITDCVLKLKEHHQMFVDAGVDVIEGIVEGIKSLINKPGEILEQIGANLPEGFKHALGISSPSKVMASISKWIPEGIAKGIEDNGLTITRSVEDMGFGIVESFAKYSALAAETAGESYFSEPTIRPVVDMSQVSASAGSVNGFFANQSMTLAGINGTLEAQGISLREQMNQNRIYNDSNVLASMQGLRNDVNTLADSMAQMQIVMDTGATVGALAPGIDKAIGVRRTLKGRGV